MKSFSPFVLFIFAVTLLQSCKQTIIQEEKFSGDPIDLVDPLIGSLGIESLGQKPLIQLPHGLLSISPLKGDFTSNYIEGLPLVSIPSLGACQFLFCPRVDTLSTEIFLQKPIRYTFDYEEVTPYKYKVYLDKEGIQCNYTLQENSGIYELEYNNSTKEERRFILKSFARGTSFTPNTKNSILGTLPLKKKGTLYLYFESNNDFILESQDSIQQQIALTTKANSSSIAFRYGISLISHEQARENLRLQIPSYEYNVVAKSAKNKWNTKLERITLTGGNIKQHKLLYTALYRTLTSPVCISENGRYYSPYDDSIHNDLGVPFYTIDNTSESFHTLHPLRTLLFPETEHHILKSYIRILEEKEDGLLPSYPSLSGDIASSTDENRMLEIFIDAYNKGINDIDIQKVYTAGKLFIETGNPDEYDKWAYAKLALFSGHPLNKEEKEEINKITNPSLKLIDELEPYNIEETIKKCGSDETFEKLLDETFENLLLASCNVHNLYGYYLYAFTKHPHKGQKILRHTLYKNFRCDPAGFPNAIDGPSLGASVVFSMLGFYPITSGNPTYTIGSPIFSQSTLNQGGGRYFTIQADKASELNKYVSDITLNDRPLKGLHFSHSNIAQGGTLKMKMSEKHQ